jgi:hypothetical protein
VSAIAAPIDVAPEDCIVCGEKNPHIENAPGWTYLAGAVPLGAVACSLSCTAIAIDRFKRTGRCDLRVS